MDKKYTDGVYVLIKFNGDSAAVNEVDRLMKIDERLLRHLVTRVGE
ncbi:MAG: 30S ribosomal protein S6 [Peptococcus niger]